ncbi:MAG: TerB family tellurite resistance protein [Gammaproteobacteria bacterium]|nr:TerB family tellurite resistance protein [Gammaproteobacteria bacterium]MBU1555144.1 TerB family tellurite resistance protein [Gammaproteobacteria bacterium]MBU2070262.1 TerB family tellurite resistance protein [Gammaproteobacteria bacterium]MBU2183965.1 TerB family tellurite resistance protein [Gammaproteobacteria bacterium]MBU2206769.1 TerB family tellurite resistance protein [Gammaproteobacteria bacterium]
MHIILGVLGALVTILILLNRLTEAGVDVGWLNPFSWHRRRKYRKQHDLNPMFKLDQPLDVAALYLVAAAKVDGDVTASQKTALLTIFCKEFHLSDNAAKQLLSSSVHLIGNGQEFYQNPELAAQRVYDKLTAEQVESIVVLLRQVINIDGTPSSQQTDFVSRITKAMPVFQAAKKW